MVFAGARPPSVHVSLACLLLVAVSGCRSDSLQGPAGKEIVTARPLLSSISLPVGSQLTVAVDASTEGATLGSLSGTLRFDPTRLRYVGQSPYDSLAYPLVVVNDAGSESGQLEVASVDPEGLSRRVALIAFEVLAPDYANGLDFSTELAASVQLSILTQSGEVEPATIDSQLPYLPGAVRMDDAQWDRISARLRAATLIDQVPAGRRYGDVDGNGSVSVVDALWVTGWSLGLHIPAGSQIPVPGDLAELVGNISPANLPGLGEAADTNGPGWTSQCTRKWDVVDGLTIALRSIGLPAPIAGSIIPSDAVDPSLHGPRLPRRCGSNAAARVLLIVDPGVAVLSAPTDTLYPSGTVLPYSFALAPGFDQLTVTIDGVVAPASGSLVMNQPHFVFATAHEIQTLPAELLPLQVSARAVLTASNKVAAYQTHLDQVASYAANRSPADAARLLTLLYDVTYDEIADSVPLRQMDEALGNRIFLVGGSASLNHAGRPGIRSIQSAPGPEPTLYLYVNGIWSTESQANATLGILAGMILRNPELADGTALFGRFYNRTRLATPENPERTRARCLAQLRLFRQVLTPEQWQTSVNACLGRPQTAPILFTDDVLESWRQLMDINNYWNFYLADVDTLAQRIDSIRTTGTHVIAVGHSQGTLLLNQAVNKLEQDGKLDLMRDSIGLGVVTLAAPTDQGFPTQLQNYHLRHIVVDGDLIPALGVFGGIPNTTPGTVTPLSLEYRADLAEAEGTLAFQSLFMTWTRAKWVARMHSVNNAYLGQEATAGILIQDLIDIKHEVTVGGIAANGFVQPVVGQFFDAGQYFLVRNKNERPLYGRRVTYTSSDSTVLRVSPAGTAVAVTPGTATITANVKGYEASLAVTVTEPSPFPGKFVFGIWDGTVAFPEETCTATLTINFDGRMILNCPTSGQSSLFWPMREFPPNYTHVVLRQNDLQQLDLSLAGDGNTLAGTWIWYPCCYPAGISVSFSRRM